MSIGMPTKLVPALGRPALGIMHETSGGDLDSAAGAKQGSYSSPHLLSSEFLLFLFPYFCCNITLEANGFSCVQGAGWFRYQRVSRLLILLEASSTGL